MREATHGSDVLLSQVMISHGTVSLLLEGLADAVDLLVDLSAVVVAELTSTRNRERDTGGVPSANTGDLSATSVGLATQHLYAPTLDNTSVTLTLGDTDAVKHLILGEDGGDGNFLLKHVEAEADLVSDGSTVDLNIDDVGSLLASAGLADLSVADGADRRAVLPSALDLSLHLVVLHVLLGVLGEGLSLRLVPVLVEAAADLLRQVLGPDGCQSAHALRSLDVTDEADNAHGGSLENSDGLNDFLLVELRSGLIDVSDDVSHTSLEADEGGEVAGLRSIILGERLDLTVVVSGSLAGQEAE